MPNKYDIFDQNTAIFLIQCCQEAYNQYNNNGNFNIPGDYTLVSGFKTTLDSADEWFGFVLESSDKVVVTFGGNFTSFDWLAEMNMTQTQFPFYPRNTRTQYTLTSIYSACREQLFNILSNLDPSKRLHLTGHSLGGALATLLTLDAAVNTRFKQPIMYNFGSPRVGNAKFAATYNKLIKNSIRVVNIYDLVCCLPSTTAASMQSKQRWFYEHINSQVLIARQTGSIIENHSLSTYFDALTHLRP